MIERIQQIMDYENLKPGEFAEQIGINRSAISHILNGRNKPSLDVVNRILTRFDYISSDWLLFGNGEIQKKKVDQHSSSNKSYQQFSLFDKKQEIEDKENNPQEERIESKLIENNQKLVEKDTPVPASYLNDYKEIQMPINKKITKLIIFYSDNTFDTFSPERGLF